MTWKLLSRNEAFADWNERLFGFEDFTYPQTFEWGEYRSQFGWRPYRWIATDSESNTITLLQGLLRVYPGRTGLLWSAGGPAGDLSFCDSNFIRILLESTGMKRLYFRFNAMRPYRVSEVLSLRGNGWKRTPAPFQSGMSMYYDLSKDDEIRYGSATKNWRHNLRRSQKYALSICQWENPDVNAMYALYESMQDYKQLSQQYSRQELEKIFEQLGRYLVLFRCEDETGEPVALRGCIILGAKAWDLFAATSVKGRKIYASYALFWQLTQFCKKSGVTLYDMSGIDPFSNPGVYDFKKGTGAYPVEFLGEWEWATSEWLRWGVNWQISRRSGSL